MLFAFSTPHSTCRSFQSHLMAPGAFWRYNATCHAKKTSYASSRSSRTSSRAWMSALITRAFVTQQHCWLETRISGQICSMYGSRLGSSPPGENGRHFACDIFRCILVNEKNCILTKILLKFVPKGLIDNNPALF